MKPLYNNIIEGWVDKVNPKWHPEEGLFTGNDPEYIASYLLKHSDDKGQAMQRLNFYMNRAGNRLTNKTVLNKVKKLLSETLLDSDYEVPNTSFFEYPKFTELLFDGDWKKWRGAPEGARSKKLKWPQMAEELLEISKLKADKQKNKFTDRSAFVYSTISNGYSLKLPRMVVVANDDAAYIVRGNPRGEVFIEKFKNNSVESVLKKIHNIDYSQHFFAPDGMCELLDAIISDAS